MRLSGIIKAVCMAPILLLHCGLRVWSQEPLPLDPAVRTGQLPNGLRYYIRHNAEPAHRVVLYLANKTGSLMETEQERGFAHFIEHMSFNGTTHFPKNQLIDYLQRSGVRFGADINAFTSFDETVYQLPIPSDQPALLTNGLQILRDWAQGATLDPVEIDKERGVVLEEKRLGKGAGERMRTVYWPLILNHSRYADRLPIGLDTVLEHFQPAALRAYYQAWYRPDLQAVIVVGDIDVEAMEGRIRALFSDLRNPVRSRQRVAYTVGLTGRNQFIRVTDKETSQVEAQVLIKHPGAGNRTAADYRRQLVTQLFDQLLQYRYAELMRQADPPFQSASAGIGPFIGGLDVYNATVTMLPGRMEAGFKAMWRENERVKQFGFTQEELDRVKTNYLRSMETAYQERTKRSSVAYANEYQQYFLKGDAAPGIEVEYQLVKKELPGIGLAELDAIARRCFVARDRDILFLGPEKELQTLPDSATVDRWIREVGQEPLTAYHVRVTTQALLRRMPVAGLVVHASRDTALGITELRMSNGVRVILKPTNFRNEEVVFSGFSFGGTSLYADSDLQSAAAAAGIVSAGGVGNYGVSDLQQFLTGKQVSVQPYIGEISQGVSGSARTGDLETALQLVYGYLTEPRKDTAMFENIVRRSRAGLLNRGDDPGAVFQDTASALLGNYHVRRTGPSLAKLGQLDLEKAYQIYRERFVDASGFTFCFVGNFDSARIRPLLELYLGSLPATHAGETFRDPGIRPPRGVISKTVFKGKEARATVQLLFSGDLVFDQASLLRLQALKEVLQIRLIERLREEESGVYTPQVGVSASKLPHAGYIFSIGFGCAPGNVDKLVASALDEVSKLRAEGPSPANLDKWKAEDRNSRETQVRTNGWWLGYLGRQLQYGDDLHQLDRYAADRDGIGVADLRDAARLYLDPRNYIRLVLMPAGQ